MGIIEHFKFIDSVIILLILRVLYIAVKNGFLCEVTKVLVVFLASFLSFQYYPVILRQFSVEGSSRQYLEFLSFFTIFTVTILTLSFLRRIIVGFRGPVTSKYSSLRRWLSFLLGIGRASLLASTFIFGFYLLPPKDNLFRGSASFRVFRCIAPKSYIFAFGLYRRAVAGVQFNQEVMNYYEGKKDLPRSSRKGNRG
jgi:uncharacterized membrane protein required for colicin V production